ncbi:AfsR/SARP family transcriptional regulator [Streptomyces sp. NBC_01198]|uniref:AfsR/SARP family transcriptional regulator n=1 Tax=Streptomyces sp. NBC_01198 TaxID=2903769 RepID=UPI002E128A53|nr:tetratricopeptide repeat protein [Streptomyces sp. NBC_01198]
MEVDILVLGPVELWVGGQREMYGAAKASHLLAALAVDAGRSVPLDTLAGRLWDDSPPAKPGASLHTYATRIRHKLGHDRVAQQSHAYRLDIEPDAVDQHRFERLTAQARSLAASGDDTEALALLRQAESLWRGTPLTGFTGLWTEQVRRRLTELRTGARVLRAEIEVRAGRFARALDDLTPLIEQHPLDETVAALFMTAAYGCGRQSDALRAYDALRRRLREEGAEPGEALVRVHRGILDRAPAGELPGRRSPGPAPPAPYNLPAHSGVLIGRAEELRALRAAAPGVVAFQTVTGMVGVGKTQLALHTARRLARHYPAGQIYLNLQAHSGRTPMSPQAALATLLRHFGVPATGVPRHQDELTTLWRTVLSSRRAIVVLDDAAGPEQIRPLLPGDSASLVIVTSRRRLTGLPGVRHVVLDVLSPADAEKLFSTLAEDGRRHDPADVAELARLCGYLPLAVELIAARLRSRPSWTAAHLVGRLSDGPGPLAEIRDGRHEIATAFAMSYETLPPTHQRVFRLLSLHFGPTFCPQATAALVGLPLPDTERVLEDLLDAHLVREPAPERYELHDLLAAYARSLVDREPAAERDTALGRLASFHLHAVAAADRVLFDRRPRLDLGTGGSPFALPAWTGSSDARAWLREETDALVAAELHFRGRGDALQAARLAHVAAGLLDSEGLWAEAERMHTHAAGWWRSAGERAPEAHALLALAAAQSQTGRYDAAGRTARRAREVAVDVGDTATEAESLRELGLLDWNLGRLKESRTLLSAALRLRERLGDPWHVARCRNNLGITLLHLGEHAPAAECFRQALAGFVRTRDPRGEAQALNNLGDFHLHLGETELARTAFRRSLDIVSRVGSRAETAVARLNLANTMPIPDELPAALEMHREALAVFRNIGDKRNEVVTLNAIGTALLGAGQHAESAAHHAAALALARNIGATQEEIQALRGVGLADLRAGRSQACGEQLSAALLIARRIGAEEEEARTHSALAELYMAVGDRAEAASHLRSAYSIHAKSNKWESDRTRDRLAQLQGS